MLLVITLVLIFPVMASAAEKGDSLAHDEETVLHYLYMPDGEVLIMTPDEFEAFLTERTLRTRGDLCCSAMHQGYYYYETHFYGAPGTTCTVYTYAQLICWNCGAIWGNPIHTGTYTHPYH